MSIKFGTKAETLKHLESVVTTCKILPQICIVGEEFQQDQRTVTSYIEELGWQDQPLIVRSSARAEDTAEQSFAGHFTSVPDVLGEVQLVEAITEVANSYAENLEHEQILIQPMLAQVKLSGVAFSVVPDTGSPYVVINYDDQSNSTSSVTSGQSNDLKTFYYLKLAKIKLKYPFNKIAAMISELESLFDTNTIDIEFAITDEDELYLLQVRPLVGVPEPEITAEQHHRALINIEKRIRELNQPHPYLRGTRTVFGVMPDWNPAEIIGICPRPLALSLYKELITDNIWGYQRSNYGYKNLRSFPLLINFYGLPYIDVRVSFNSFIPADVDDTLAERLVNYYIDRLLESPNLHDKVEFEIVFSCYTLDLSERLTRLRKHGFTEDECCSLAESLRILTNRIIRNDSGLWRQDINKIKHLENRINIITESSLDKVSKIFWLIEDCKRYGTLPFAGLARAGFIAVQLLSSLIRAGVLSPAEYELFLGSLNTISSQLTRDFARLSKEEFLKRYGHLRPGTYNLLSPRYDEEPERYFDWPGSPNNPSSNESPQFSLSLEQLGQIQKLLKEHQLEHDVLGLFDFIEGAIEGREYAKFVFTRSLSEGMSLFKELGAENDLSAEDCSFADIKCIHHLYSSSADLGALLKQNVEEGKNSYVWTKQLKLPPLITHPEHVWAFHLPQCEPNFITLKRATGHVAFANNEHNRIHGSVMMIPSADPGYDWIFSHKIAALITKYGGVNSHMAIRAGELGIPAVIGAGEALYAKWAKAEVLEVDCANKQVQILK